MKETEFPRSYPVCQKCGCEETATSVAMKEMANAGENPPEGFTSMKKLAIPLQQPARIALTMPVLFVHWDACFECGLERITKVERINMPITVQVGQGGQGPMPLV